eukprot:gene10335-11243_t
MEEELISSENSEFVQGIREQHVFQFKESQVDLLDGKREVSDDDDDDIWNEEAGDGEFRSHITEERTLRQAGYRDGQAEVAEISRQKGFDDGFKEGMITGKLIGAFIGELIGYLHELQNEKVVDWEMKKSVDDLINSLMYRGSQEKYSSAFLDQLLLTIQRLPSQYQEQYQAIRERAQTKN